MKKLTLIFLGFILFINSAFATGATQRTLKLVIDITPLNEGQVEVPIFAYDDGNLTPNDCDLVAHFFKLPTENILKEDLPSSIAKGQGNGDNAKYADTIKNCSFDNRFFIKKGDKVVVKVIYIDGMKPEVSFSESKRKTELETGLGVFLETRPKGVTDKSRQTKYSSALFEHVLEYNRAKLSFNLSYKSKKAEGSPQESTFSKGYQIITGPMEHFYLSVDLSLMNNDTVLRYDSRSSTLEPEEIPMNFYISLNFLLGDVLKENLPAISLDRISLKLLLSPDAPLESWGLGVGYKLPKFSIFDMSLGETTLFIGGFSEKQDSMDSGKINENMRKTIFKAGISFSIDKLSKWSGTE